MTARPASRSDSSRSARRQSALNGFPRTTTTSSPIMSKHLKSYEDLKASLDQFDTILLDCDGVSILFAFLRDAVRGSRDARSLLLSSFPHVYSTTTGHLAWRQHDS